MSLWPDDSPEEAERQRACREQIKQHLNVKEVPDDLFCIMDLAANQIRENGGRDPDGQRDMRVCLALLCGGKPRAEDIETFRARNAQLRTDLWSRGVGQDELLFQIMDVLDNVEMRLTEVRQ